MPRAPSLAKILAGSKSDSFRRLNGSMFPAANVGAPVAQVKRIRPDGIPGGPRYRSAWERQFHDVLKARFPGAWIEHEPMSLRLATGAKYTPDFCVAVKVMDAVPCGENPGLPALHQFTFWEVKGHWREAARVRIKIAARLFPWARFVAVVKQKKRDGGGWKEELFSP